MQLILCRPSSLVLRLSEELGSSYSRFAALHSTVALFRGGRLWNRDKNSLQICLFLMFVSQEMRRKRWLFRISGRGVLHACELHWDSTPWEWSELVTEMKWMWTELVSSLLKASFFLWYVPCGFGVHHYHIWCFINNNFISLIFFWAFQWVLEVLSVCPLTSMKKVKIRSCQICLLRKNIKNNTENINTTENKPFSSDYWVISTHSTCAGLWCPSLIPS